MYRQILFPTEQNHTIDLPEEYYGLEVEVIAFPVNEKKVFLPDIDSFYDAINLDFLRMHPLGKGFQFNREEANER